MSRACDRREVAGWLEVDPDHDGMVDDLMGVSAASTVTLQAAVSAGAT